jgi:Ca2+-binding EF-hand superfamily protein
MKLFILNISIFIILTINLTTSIKLNKALAKHEWEEKWQTLFGTAERNKETCDKDIPPPRVATITSDPQNDADRAAGLPFSKPDPYEFTYHPNEPKYIEYLYDYLDPVLKEPILNDFRKIYKEALELQGEGDIDDQYTLDKMIYVKSHGTETEENLSKLTDIEQKIKRAKDFFPNTKFDNYEKEISVPRIKNITKKWYWNVPAGKESAKKIVDKYDYNGNGRLDAYEFLQFSIINAIGQQLPGALNNYSEIFLDKIDAIFHYFDCNDDLTVGAETMWNGFMKLQRHSDTFDIYKCHNNLRTSATNAFILRFGKNNAQLTLEDFRLGVLIGYLKRHVSADAVKDETLDGIDKRWAKDGMEDLECEKFKKFTGK